MPVLLDPVAAAEGARRRGLLLPNPSSHDGRYNTLNQKGAMFHRITPLDEQFLAVACQPHTRVLEIGSAFGLLCVEALRRGARHYTAIDTDERHLMILAREVSEKVGLPTDSNGPTLRLVHGAFPAGEGVLNALRGGAPYDAIIATHVLQFLTEPEVRQAFDAFHELLKPGGHLFVTAGTIHAGWFREEVHADLIKQVEDWVATAGQPLDHRPPLPVSLPSVRDAVDERKFAEHKVTPDDFNLTRGHYFLFSKEVMDYLVSDRRRWDTPLQCDYEEGPKDVWTSAFRTERDRIVLIVRKKISLIKGNTL